MRALFALVLTLTTSAAMAKSCITPQSQSDAVVMMSILFAKKEVKKGKEVTRNLRISGTGWFINANHLITVAHLLDDFPHPEGWFTIQLHRAKREGRPQGLSPIRTRLVEMRRDKDYMVLEVAPGNARARPLPVRRGLLFTNEEVSALGYPYGLLRYAKGRLYRDVPEEVSPSEWYLQRYAGQLLLEMSRNNNRLALQFGASGAPIMDCDGRVIGIMTAFMHDKRGASAKKLQKKTKKLQYVPTPKGLPTIIATPIRPLIRYSDQH